MTQVKYESTLENKCLFCKIAQKEIEPLGNGIFLEDENYIAFLSPFPNTKGFSVVIPKKHYASDVLKMPDAELSEFLLFAKRAANMLETYFEDVGRVGLIMEGTGIDHAHIKLFPMHGTEHMKKGEWKQYLSTNETYYDTYEGYIASNDGPKANLDEIKELASDIRKKCKHA